jgi:hypothetical protein
VANIVMSPLIQTTVQTPLNGHIRLKKYSFKY